MLYNREISLLHNTVGVGRARVLEGKEGRLAGRELEGGNMTGWVAWVKSWSFPAIQSVAR